MTTVDPSHVHHAGVSTSMEAVPTFKLHELSSTSNPTRHQIVALLCTAAFSDDREGSAAAATLVEALLKLCGGSKPLLSSILQMRFLSGRTPLHSIVCSVDSRKMGVDIHPVIKALLDHCQLPLASEARDDIEIACCEQNNNGLLHTLRRHPAFSPWASGESGYQAVVVGQDAGSVSFTIPKFLDQMLAESKVEFPFVLRGFFFRCTLSSRPGSGIWALHIVLDKAKSRPRQDNTPYHITLSIQKLSMEEQPWLALGKYTYKQLTSHGGVDVNILRLRNPGILGKERELSGKLEVEHWNSDWANAKV